jgi:hypothetical protein
MGGQIVFVGLLPALRALAGLSALVALLLGIVLADA